MSDTMSEHHTLERHLSNRHIQMIGLGGTLGTGLFLGSAGVLSETGPSMLLAYVVCGIALYLIMRCLGEMIVHEPVSGSFTYFATKYWCPAAGFIAGWNSVVLYVLVGMLELSAVGKLVQFWWPWVPTWATALVCFVAVNSFNFVGVRAYGEIEFWLALVKVGAVVLMIGGGIYLLCSRQSPQNSSITNLWEHGGFFVHGVGGFMTGVVLVMFSFGGLEMVGFTAAESKDPHHTIPKAINQIILRILLFYIGSISIVLILIPWDDLLARMTVGGDPYVNSPFVIALSSVTGRYSADVLNVVIITASLSVYNSIVYCNSRLLHGMSMLNEAPAIFARTNASGVPVPAVILTAIATGSCVLMNYVISTSIVGALISIIVPCLLINWTIMLISHLKFREKVSYSSNIPKFVSPLFPFSNYACLSFLCMVAVIMVFSPSLYWAAVMLPVWLLVLYSVYKVKAFRDRWIAAKNERSAD